MKKYFFFLIAAAAGLQGCSKFLDKQPFADLTTEKVFQNANDMALYVNSFYTDQIPSAQTIASDDNVSDYISGNNIPAIMLSTTNPNSVGGWSSTTPPKDIYSWSVLRNINYFLDNCDKNPAIPAATINGFKGIARYFRALFYFNMTKRYGDVPWYGHALSASDSSMYKPRDSRVLVMDSVVADLDFAIANLTATPDVTCSTITKWVALALKSRVCLFEGTFRRYHTEWKPNLTATADDFLNKSLDASSQLINSGKFKLHNTGRPASDYRDLFTTEAPWSEEVILASTYSNSLKLWSQLNQLFTSPTLGNRSSLNKQFVDTYLNLDGTRFTDQASFDAVFFVDEMKNRDLRLQQTVRCNGYKRTDGSSAPPDFAYTFTGYHIMKYTLDDKNLDYKAQNNNSVPIFRYAEILLNYAEAKAELNTFNASDWSNTIQKLRARAGITNAPYPTVADPYLRDTYFSDLGIADPALLEIRRERGVELVCEGLRFDDIRRWKAGKALMTMPYLGVYVPKMNTVYAMNGDGVNNVSFVSAAPSSPATGVTYYKVDNKTVSLTNGTYGNIHWLINYDDVRDKNKWDDRFYYYPIPTNETVLNPALDQRYGWEKF
ncbi:hypothetical protein A4H97_08705 [Niastella yeongjuensis]|uniref:Carbohydrate-binding protein SusD n=1 Tax=Niastella yeongjuensis TaxID=354355 RepID=A0A1V9EE94_9BACT|nr:RagB/SusD family nutrient uptake outer membrane protein [Niastella yeongjuensis]OQP44448.1 hypothetical protein A4H97_08705 [Niastella yeongjuensis]SEO87339.1 Starch-binding associating with outer membrane [Niastella yeongjuensis]